jgi:hypothetical protein
MHDFDIEGRRRTVPLLSLIFVLSNMNTFKSIIFAEKEKELR